jgi:hypothetical protein
VPSENNLNKMTTAHTKDELLYLARLAEQSERYDGKYSFPHAPFPIGSNFLPHIF